MLGLPNPLLDIHADIRHLLHSRLRNSSIPNILLHGPSGSGKKTLILELLLQIYTNDMMFAENVMVVDCANGRGIHFIRDELKNFAKTKALSSYYKSIVLTMADKLTIDAQSALRRCIEVHCANTRFFVIIEKLDHLIKPIQSRFCCIYVDYPTINGMRVNLHSHLKKNVFVFNNADRIQQTIDFLEQCSDADVIPEIFKSIEKLYELAISGHDILKYLEAKPDNTCNPLVFLYLHHIRPHIRHEKIYILMVLYIAHIRKTSITEYVFNV